MFMKSSQDEAASKAAHSLRTNAPGRSRQRFRVSTRLVRLVLEVLAGAERLLGGFEAGGTLRFGEVKTDGCLEVVAE